MTHFCRNTEAHAWQRCSVFFSSFVFFSWTLLNLISNGHFVNLLSDLTCLTWLIRARACLPSMVHLSPDKRCESSLNNRTCGCASQHGDTCLRKQSGFLMANMWSEQGFTNTHPSAKAVWGRDPVIDQGMPRMYSRRQFGIHGNMCGYFPSWVKSWCFPLLNPLNVW